MDVKDKADLFLEKYSDRSKLPDDEKQLKEIIRFADRCKQELIAEIARLEKEELNHNTKRAFNEKTKK